MKKLLFAALMLLSLSVFAIDLAPTGHWERIRLAHPVPAGMQGDYTYTSANAWLDVYKGREFALAIIDDNMGTIDVALAVKSGGAWLARMPRIVAGVTSAMIANGPSGPRTTREWFATDVLPGANVLMDREIHPSCPANMTDRVAIAAFDLGSGDFRLDDSGHWVLVAPQLSHVNCPQ